MKLSKCTHGTIVICTSGDEPEIGMVVGLTYNLMPKVIRSSNLSAIELCEHTIPLIQFPDSTRGIHYSQLELYKDKICQG